MRGQTTCRRSQQSARRARKLFLAALGAIAIAAGLPVELSRLVKPALDVGPMRALAQAPGRQLAYVANSGSDTVSVLDIDTARVTAEITVGRAPGAIAISPDGDTLFVANRDDDSLSEIDTASQRVVRTIDVGDFPDGLGFLPDGSELYVSNRRADTVSIIEVATGRLITELAVRNEPMRLAVHPDGDRVYVVEWGADSVSVIDTAARAVVETIPVPIRPVGLAIHPDEDRVFVTSVETASLWEIDAQANTVRRAAQVERPFGLALHPAGDLAYIPFGSTAPRFNSGVAVVDLSAGAIRSTIPVGRLGNYAVITSDGQHVLVPNRLDGSISIIDTRTDGVIETVSVGAEPLDIVLGSAPILPPTPEPTTTPSPPSPEPPAPPDTPTPEPSSTPEASVCVCDTARRGVPNGMVQDAVANPMNVAGWGQRLDPGKPAGPFNPPRTCLSVRSPASPFHPIFNSLIWKAGCP